ncbi:MAG TPA: O-antigen ligase family protein [Anaeromyxobacteraceae bacterium]|nr:O-antigen ligase family protein [Anaeromyxobacteraceae bacterium]
MTSPRLERALERAAALGVLAHAAFLPISMAGMQIGLAVAAGALLLLRLGGRRVWARSGLDLPCLLLPAACVVSLATGALGGSPPVGLHEATLWRSLLAAPVLLSAVEVTRGRPGAEDPGGPRRLALAALGVWAVAALVPSAIAWVQFRTGFDPLFALGLRREPVRAVVPIYPGRFAAVGFFRWYQRLAHNLTPPLCVAAALALAPGLGARRRALLGLAALAAAAAVVLTLSRSSWAGLVAAGLLLALSGAVPRRRAVPLVLAGALAMALHPGVRTRLSHLRDPTINDDRKALWSVCRAVVDDHPLGGVGFGNLPRRSRAYYERLAIPANYPWRGWCHDSFFTARAEGGPLLLAALTAFWALLARAFLRLRREATSPAARLAATGALAALVAMLGNSLFHDLLYSSEAMFGLGFALGMAAALARAPAAAAAAGAGDQAGCTRRRPPVSAA